MNPDTGQREWFTEQVPIYDTPEHRRRYANRWLFKREGGETADPDPEPERRTEREDGDGGKGGQDPNRGTGRGGSGQQGSGGSGGSGGSVAGAGQHLQANIDQLNRLSDEDLLRSLGWASLPEVWEGIPDAVREAWTPLMERYNRLFQAAGRSDTGGVNPRGADWAAQKFAAQTTLLGTLAGAYRGAHYGTARYPGQVTPPATTDPTDPNPTDPVDPDPTDPVGPDPTDPVDTAQGPSGNRPPDDGARLSGDPAQWLRQWPTPFRLPGGWPAMWDSTLNGGGGAFARTTLAKPPAFAPAWQSPKPLVLPQPSPQRRGFPLPPYTPMPRPAPGAVTPDGRPIVPVDPGPGGGGLGPEFFDDLIPGEGPRV